MLGLDECTLGSDTVFFSPSKLVATFPSWASSDKQYILVGSLPREEEVFSEIRTRLLFYSTLGEMYCRLL